MAVLDPPPLQAFWPLAAYAGGSLAAFLAYAWDKRQAVRGGRRVPESTLHLLELVGGWPGAFLAQRVLRHKNAKVPYQVVFWLIGALHVVFWAWQAGWLTH